MDSDECQSDDDWRRELERDRDFEALVEGLGFVLDHGNLISGPFIPDGHVRIYRPETIRVVAEGRTVAEAAAEFEAYVKTHNL